MRDARVAKERAAFGLAPSAPAEDTDADDAEHLNHGKGK